MNLASFGLFVISVLIIVSGIFNTILTALFFGTSRELEVYFAILVIYNSVIRLSQIGHLNELFLPHYRKIRDLESFSRATSVFSMIINWMGIFTIIICALLFFLREEIVGLFFIGFDQYDKILGEKILLLIVPLIFTSIISSMLKIIINAERYYVNVEFLDFISKILYPIFLIISFNFYGIFSLVVALWISQLARIILYVWILYSKVGFRHRLKLYDEKESFFKMYSKVIRLFAQYSIFTQIYMISLNAFLTTLPQGSYAVIKYVESLFGAIESLIMKPISIIFFTEFNIYLNNITQRIKVAAKSLNFAIIVLMLIYLVFIIIGREGLFFIWGGEKFPSYLISEAYDLLLLILPLLSIMILGMTHRKVIINLQYIGPYYFLASIVQIICLIVLYFYPLKIDTYTFVYFLFINQFLMSATPFILIQFLKIKDHIYLWNTSFLFKLFFSWILTLFLSFLISDFINLNVDQTRLMLFFKLSITGILVLFIFLINLYFFGFKKFITNTAFVNYHKIKNIFK